MSIGFAYVWFYKGAIEIQGLSVSHHTLSMLHLHCRLMATLVLNILFLKYDIYGLTVFLLGENNNNIISNYSETTLLLFCCLSV